MKIVGLMSGTSLDGVDLALCQIDSKGYSLLDAATIPYSPEWRNRLATVEQGSALQLALTHVELGHLLGRMVRDFLAGCPCDAVASHGHTIFHQPDRRLTLQIGCPDAMAAECGLLVVSDFRTLDVALGGQGAPLVPIGDRLFFAAYDACLNLGGIANISFEASHRVAYDICPCNMLLNRLAAERDMTYDPDGQMASQGQLLPHLLEQMNELEYYRTPLPKTLGKEWFESECWPRVQAAEGTIEDKMRTAVEHVAQQIARAVDDCGAKRVLATGGGVHNRFLLSRLEAVATAHFEVPDRATVDYKEAIIFALLGYLRINQQVNTLQSVTGARCDSIGGRLSGLVAQEV